MRRWIHFGAYHTQNFQRISTLATFLCIQINVYFYNSYMIIIIMYIGFSIFGFLVGNYQRRMRLIDRGSER